MYFKKNADILWGKWWANNAVKMCALVGRYSRGNQISSPIIMLVECQCFAISFHRFDNEELLAPLKWIASPYIFFSFPQLHLEGRDLRQFNVTSLCNDHSQQPSLKHLLIYVYVYMSNCVLAAIFVCIHVGSMFFQSTELSSMGLLYVT